MVDEPKPEANETSAPTEAARAAAEPAPAPVEEPQRLWRSRDDRVIAGVCGGLGAYLRVDPVLVRIAAVILIFAGGAGVVLYVVGWIAIPEEPGPGARATRPAATTGDHAERTAGAVVLGLVFVGLGALFLADEIWPDFLSWKYVWPVALIAVGAAILLRSRQ